MYLETVYLISATLFNWKSNEPTNGSIMNGKNNDSKTGRLILLLLYTGRIKNNGKRTD
jgi:hypothetical protein